MRVSLGGVRDEAEIRGHRRTYIGSMPGKVIQSMRKANIEPAVPVGRSGQDWALISAAIRRRLCSVLDPEQNHAFNDHYLEVDYDLSHVMFITTANTLNIRRP